MTNKRDFITEQILQLREISQRFWTLNQRLSRCRQLWSFWIESIQQFAFHFGGLGQDYSWILSIARERMQVWIRTFGSSRAASSCWPWGRMRRSTGCTLQECLLMLVAFERSQSDALLLAEAAWDIELWHELPAFGRLLAYRFGLSPILHWGLVAQCSRVRRPSCRLSPVSNVGNSHCKVSSRKNQIRL